MNKFNLSAVKILNLIIPLIILTLGIPQSDHYEIDYYNKGVEHLEKGENEKALNLWLEAKNVMSADGEADFRIGVRFIEHVTSKNLSHLYPAASEIYYWGLNSLSLEKKLDYVKTEVEMLKPLVEERTYIEWQKKLEERNPDIFSDIKGFWISKNPSASTPVNERLIEHWERIAHARDTYTKNSSTVYGTDDRGLIYIKYGAPDKIDSGLFLLNSTKIQFYAREIFRQQDEDIGGRGVEMSVTEGESSFQGRIMDSYFMDNLAKMVSDRVFSQRISRDYEVWVYENHQVGLPQNLLFIFGVNANDGKYGIQKSPEEFIPQSSFRMRNVRIGDFNFNIGPILQLSLYHDLRFVDDTFMDIYHELYDILLSDQSMITLQATEYLTHKFADELESMRNAAPDNLSIYDRELPELPLNTRSYRFLDDNSDPYNLLVVYSEPHNFIFSDYHRFTDHFEDREPNYHVRHNLTLHDKDWNILNSQNDFPPIFFESSDLTGSLIPSSTMFRIPEIDSGNKLFISGSLFNESYASVSPPWKNELLQTPDYLLAESRNSIDLNDGSDMLSRSEFEVSDLVVGYRADFDLDEDVFIPFYLPHDNKLSKETDLHFLFEVYNIPQDTDNIYRFRVEYKVESSERRNLVSRIFTRSSAETSITMNIEEDQPVSKQHISVDLSDYEPGDYELQIRVIDQEEEQVIVRNQAFTIVESSEPFDSELIESGLE